MRLKLYRGRWYAVWRENGTTKRKTLETMDRGVAERRLTDLIRIRKLEGSTGTVSQLMKAYLEEKKSARSFNSMETAWRAVEAMFGNLRPDQITRELCRSYTQKRRAAGISDGTIIKDLGVLKAAVNFAGKGSGAAWDMPAAPPPRERYLTKDERDRLLEACDLPHLKLFVELALGTAGRAGALLDLTWDRVDFERGQIRLSRGEGRRKGRATVKMSSRLMTALLEAQKAATTEYVIEWAGKKVGSVKRSFETACEKAGLEDVTPHVLRHTAAVWMAEAGISMSKIAQFLGHTKTSITEHVYARFSPDHMKDAADALE